eukprot:15366837-Ditylum_brightwellii.AAC.1
MGTMGTDRSKQVNAKVAYKLMGHINKTDNRNYFKYLGYEIVRGAMAPCEARVDAKAKWLSFPTRVQMITTVVGPKLSAKTINEHISIGILTIKEPANVKATFIEP